jgi:hypothetical protein
MSCVFAMLEPTKSGGQGYMTTTPSLLRAVEDVLQQGCILLEGLGDAGYAHPLDERSGASIGLHYRHVLDHFLCLRDGMRQGVIRYDDRQRDPELETSRTIARDLTEELLNEFRALSPPLLKDKYMVTYTVGYGGSGPESVESNLAREIMFCVGHAVHHYAIVKLLCAGSGIRLPYEFGIAPSTLQHMAAPAAHGN